MREETHMTAMRVNCQGLKQARSDVVIVLFLAKGSVPPFCRISMMQGPMSGWDRSVRDQLSVTNCTVGHVRVRLLPLLNDDAEK